MKSIVIINGPNLNLLGTREPNIYGNISFDDYLFSLQELYPNVHFEYFQSNHEGDLIDKLHAVGFSVDGIVFNAGAYSHTSIALADAIKSIKSPVVEVHISNIYARESYRRQSFLSPVCKGVICGFGLQSYTLAIAALINE